MVTVLLRLVSPPAIASELLGNRQVLAKSAISAAFALPFSGGAVTDTFKAGPAGPSATPMIRSARPRGVRRTDIVTPPGRLRTGSFR